ncbi:MAG: TAT-variant-translocated molybdopterin oxidoreductase [Planctomycetota bacterium]|jgi:molybdopterin-containing oxidoreductase family iron-sulfur binding subunit
MTETQSPTRQTRYWRSLDELERTEEFREFAAREFPEGADSIDGVDRRRFLQLMGASTALAGASSCRWEKTEILPFVERPEGRVPGVPVHYATAMELGGAAQALLVTSYEGRPIKVEGNPDAGTSKGAATTQAQATILELYDPDRSQVVLSNGEESSWEAFDAWMGEELTRLDAVRGSGLAVLAEASASPTVLRLMGAINRRFPDARLVQYDAAQRENERAGARLAYGRPVRTHYRLDGAKVIASFDSDLLDSHPEQLRHSRGFADGRKPEAGEMNRLYAVESRFSTTGSLADHRLPVRSESVGVVLAALEAALVAKGLAVPASWGTASTVPAGSLTDAERTQKFVAALADDLYEHQGQCLVAVGPQQSPEVHALAHRVNTILGAVGKTVLLTDDPLGERSVGFDALAGLTADMRDGKVGTLIVIGGNPAYAAPADVDFAGALSGVESLVRLGLYEDETSLGAKWHLPMAHFFESWGDARAWDGTVCLTQPLIRPLYDGRSPIEMLADVAGETYAESGELVRATAADADEKAWRRQLHDGFDEGSRFAAITPAGRAIPEPNFSATAVQAGMPAEDQLELLLYPDPKLIDGRFANSGWLQELPEFMTKLTWDNAALIGPATAKALGIRNEDLVTLTIGGRELVCAAYIMPGQAAGSVALALGYGRTEAGHVGGLTSADVPTVGFNSYRLLSSAGYAQSGLSVKRAGGSYRLASTQDHHQIDPTGAAEREARIDELVRHQTVAQYEEHPDAMQEPLLGVHYPKLQSLWKEFEYDGNKWGMSIDLSTCTGCNACVVACQSENNIPVVGKEQVLNNREMHWIRIDRYFETGVVDEVEYTGGHHGDDHGGGHGDDHGDDHASVGTPNLATQAAGLVGLAEDDHGDEGHADGEHGTPPRPHGILDEENPRVHRQPVGCIQCEMAPCEQVCPVAATVHSDEGLNAMVYNRCIGTRYCSNNCPVKVRRFNFFNYHKDLKKEENAVKKLSFNPEVTVRARGVMEKCTYCVQRIEKVKIEARNAKRPIADGEIVTACQQTCPADAIAFGDLNDPESRVKRDHDLSRSYDLLAYLNIKPRTAYLARITNPNPALV